MESMNLIGGWMSRLNNDELLKNGISRTSRKKKPNRSSSYHCFACFLERKPPTILNPSSGEIGSRLNTAKATFITIIGKRITAAPIYICIIIDKAIAIRIFETGPAIEISAASFRGFLRLNGSKTTGFPQPNPTRSINKAP